LPLSATTRFRTNVPDLWPEYAAVFAPLLIFLGGLFASAVAKRRSIGIIIGTSVVALAASVTLQLIATAAIFSSANERGSASTLEAALDR
jgi:hypothetical protein